MVARIVFTLMVWHLFGMAGLLAHIAGGDNSCSHHQISYCASQDADQKKLLNAGTRESAENAKEQIARPSISQQCNNNSLIFSVPDWNFLQRQIIQATGPERKKTIITLLYQKPDSYITEKRPLPS